MIVMSDHATPPTPGFLDRFDCLVIPLKPRKARGMKGRFFASATVFGAIFTVLSGSIFFSAWGQSDHAKRLIEGAKKEGKLLWYTALNLNDATMLTNRFEQLYPFIKTESLRLGGRELMTKILLEANTRVFRADVIEAVGIDG